MFDSNFYGKEIAISAEQAQTLVSLYEKVCKAQGTFPDYDDASYACDALTGDIEDVDLADSILYNVSCADSDIRATDEYREIKPILDYLEME